MNPNPGLKILLRKQDYSVEFYLDFAEKLGVPLVHSPEKKSVIAGAVRLALQKEIMKPVQGIAFARMPSFCQNGDLMKKNPS